MLDDDLLHFIFKYCRSILNDVSDDGSGSGGLVIYEFTSGIDVGNMSV